MSAEVMSVAELLAKNLAIPRYQRPYRWSTKNIADLLTDIDAAIGNADRYDRFKYRIGTVILHKNEGDSLCSNEEDCPHSNEEDCSRNDVEEQFDIVDGQQRALSLVLLWLCLDGEITPPLLEGGRFSNRETQRNIQVNFEFIKDWVGYRTQGNWRDKALAAFSDTLEVVVITVDEVEEAFQLFDSQNTRGKGLDPHDLLKAYHLRAMRDRPYEMRHAVTRWEEFSPDDVRVIFAQFLFPISNWKKQRKTSAFTAKDIDEYKGVDEGSGYTYAARAKRAAPCFQIGDPFVEGEDFFLMTEHYLRMRADIEIEISSNSSFGYIKEIFEENKKPSVGFNHAKALFLCALLAYYDRFHNFDERAVKKIFIWAFMIRINMTSLGFDSINKYAIGEGNDKFTNIIPAFSEIASARRHDDIANMAVRVGEEPEGKKTEERSRLWARLRDLAGGGAR